jgi:hypothetical protein
LHGIDFLAVSPNDGALDAEVADLNVFSALNFVGADSQMLRIGGFHCQDGRCFVFQSERYRFL